MVILEICDPCRTELDRCGSQGEIQRTDRARPRDRAADDHPKRPHGRDRGVPRRVEKQDGARGYAGGFLRRIAVAKFGAEDEAPEAAAATGQAVSYLLDTNVVSEWIKPRPNAGVVSWLTQTDEDSIFLSVCTLAELRFGIALLPQGKRRRQLDDWVSNDIRLRFERRILAVDLAVADAWGILSARGQTIGRPIDVMDGLIAATAAVHAMTVVTRDVSAFKAVGTPLVNPWT